MYLAPQVVSSVFGITKGFSHMDDDGYAEPGLVYMEEPCGPLDEIYVNKSVLDYARLLFEQKYVWEICARWEHLSFRFSNKVLSDPCSFSYVLRHEAAGISMPVPRTPQKANFFRADENWGWKTEKLHAFGLLIWSPAP